MHKKLNATLIIVCSIFLALSFMNGCASKKKVVETPKPAPEVKKPEAPKPAPRPQPKETPRKVEEKVAELRESAFETIYFDFDKSDIRSGDAKILQGNYDQLKSATGVHVTIEGYCDPVGTSEYNMALGMRRAESAKSYLTKLGAGMDMFSTISFGEEKLVTQDTTQFELNRRCEFKADK